jgi:hypothetical protein
VRCYFPLSLDELHAEVPVMSNEQTAMEVTTIFGKSTEQTVWYPPMGIKLIQGVN